MFTYRAPKNKMKSWQNQFGALLLIFPISLAAAGRAALERQAAAGDAEAQYQLAEALFWGKKGRQDLEQAADWARLSAKQGHAKGQFRLAIQLLLGQGVKANVENDLLGYETLGQAVPGLEKLSEQGDADAQYKLALLHLRGLVKGKADQPYSPDGKRAARLFEKAAKGENVASQYRLASVYNSGLTGKPSRDKTLEWLRKAANNGSAYAAHDLWDVYLRYQGRRLVKLEEAKPFLIASAQQGLAGAQYHYGVALINGRLGPADKKAGFEWVKKAAGQGVGRAQFFLGATLMEGKDLQQDLPEAFYWLTLAIPGISPKDQERALRFKAINQGKLTVEERFEARQKALKFEPNKSRVTRNFSLGLAGAPSDTFIHMRVDLLTALTKQGNVSAMMYLGEYYYSTRNLNETLRWYKMAANKDHPVACAQLAMLYRQGVRNKLEPDLLQGLEWLRKAADLGHLHSMYRLGIHIFKGEVEGAKPGEGVKWITQAAERGSAHAQTSLGMMRLQGDFIEQDFAKAKEWFQTAARQNYDGAQYQLGKFYLNGRGQEKPNVQEAIKRFRLAARQGNPDAQFRLGIIHLEGTGGTKKDVQEGYRWLVISQRFKMPGVDATLKRYENVLTQAEKKRAIDEAAKFKAQNFFDPKGNGKEPAAAKVALPLKELTAKAHQGDADAQFHLAERYSSGDGVGLDSVQAWKWYKLAFLSGHGTAEAARQKMVKVQGMTLTQVLAATKLVSKFKPQKK
jgi:TPR repeat protein